MTKPAIIIAFALVSVVWIAASGNFADAQSCVPATVTSHGTATSQDTAKRNALVSLNAKLEDLFPGEFRSRMKGAVEYECKNPLLWRCLARAKVCN